MEYPIVQKNGECHLKANKPFTAMEILTQRGAEFGPAVSRFLEKHREEVQKTGALTESQSIRLLSYAYKFTRSRIQQPVQETYVDIVIDTQLGDEVGRRAKIDLCLRFLFDLRVCEQNCYGPLVLLEGRFDDMVMPYYPIATNDYLLPILYAEDYEHVAHEMLNEYFPECNRAIGGKGFIMEAEELADRMGLRVVDVRFADQTIMGQIYYNFGEVVLLDANGEPYKVVIRPGTILVSKDNCKTDAIRNSTIVHECCHMYLDRTFFLLQMMTGHPYSSYTSRRRVKQKGHKNTALDWMELQCEKLPAYLLMEQEGTRRFVEKELEGSSSIFRLRYVINELAERNKVSRSMAKYRMNELGYSSVEGISCYVDNTRIPDHSCGGNWPRGITFTISALDAAKTSVESAYIGEKLRSGEYVYVEGHLCLNDRKYLKYTHTGQLYLTKYARTHIEECCLGFQAKGRYANTVYSTGHAQRNATEQVKGKLLQSYTLVSEPGTAQYKKENKVFAEDTFLWGKIAVKLDTDAEIRSDFNKAIKYIMQMKGFTVDSMSFDIEVDRKTFYNARNNIRPKLEEVIGICVALKIPYYISEKLLRISRNVLLDTEQDMLYRSFLISAENLTVPRCNDILRQYHYNPLFGTEESEDSSQSDGRERKAVKKPKSRAKLVVGANA